MLRLTMLSCFALLVPLACNNGAEGDDLPAGAFTSGPEDDGFVVDDTGPSATSEATTTTMPPSDESTGEPAELFHDEHILPIFEEHCSASSSCHDADEPAAALDLQSEGVYDRLCSNFHPTSGTPYIDCETAMTSNSYLFLKLVGDQADVGGGGGPMPPSDPTFTEADISRIETWIIQGARQ